MLRSGTWCAAAVWIEAVADRKQSSKILNRILLSKLFLLSTSCYGEIKMADETFQSQVEGIENLANDTQAVAELGRRLVHQVAVAVAEEKRGAEISNPDMELMIAKGQPVPPQFLDQVKVDAAGLALADTVVQYLNLVIWIRIWVRIWARLVLPFFVATTPLNRFQEFSDRIRFTPEEKALLDRLDRTSR
jgi:hypothetical protein